MRASERASARARTPNTMFDYRDPLLQVLSQVVSPPTGSIVSPRRTVCLWERRGTNRNGEKKKKTRKSTLDWSTGHNHPGDPWARHHISRWREEAGGTTVAVRAGCVDRMCRHRLPDSSADLTRPSGGTPPVKVECLLTYGILERQRTFGPSVASSLFGQSLGISSHRWEELSNMKIYPIILLGRASRVPAGFTTQAVDVGTWKSNSTQITQSVWSWSFGDATGTNK